MLLTALCCCHPYGLEQCYRQRRRSAAVADVHYVAVLDYVFLAFEAEGSAGAGGGFGAGIEEGIPAEGFGADEVVLEVGVDGACALRGFGAGGDGPGTALVFARGEEADEAEERVALADEADEAALVEAIGAEEFGGFFVVHLGKLGFDLAADGGCAGVGARGDFVELVFAHGFIQIIAEGGAFADVDDVEHGPLREKHEALDELLFLVGHFEFSEREFRLEGFFGAEKESLFAFEFAGAALLEVLLEALEALLNLAEVADDQIEIDVLDVAQGIDRADVGDGIVLEGAQDVDERVDVAQAGEESSFFEGFFADGGDVGVFDGGVGGLFGAVEGGELVEAGIRNSGDADVLLAGIGVGLLLELGLGENLE